MSSEIRRSRRGRTYIIIGTVLAVLAFATAAGVASLPYLFSSVAIGTKVVVAKNPIAARTRIQASDLTMAVITPVPKLPFYDIKLVEGKGARVDIPADAPITANLVAESPDLLSSTDVTYLPIPPGFVAVQVPTSELVGVGGYVQLGDRITVLATINTSVFGASPGVSAVRTVFKNLYVVRVGPASATNAPTQLTSSLTVLMTACDAEYMYWLLNNAVLKYALESYKDYETAPTQPESTCPTLASAGGVGPKDVDKKWSFTSSTIK
jgi:Flp pilus assembly protein CpaB